MFPLCFCCVQKLTGRELPVKKLGFHSLIEMMGALPHIVAIDRPGSNDWRLFDKKIYMELHKDEPKPKPKPKGEKLTHCGSVTSYAT